MTRFLLEAVAEGGNPSRAVRRGIVLIVVLGILAILAMMITVFVTFQNVSLKVAFNFADDVRARMLAQSGIDTAMDYTVSATAREMIYWGSDPDEEGPLPGSTGVPVEQAVNPSYAVEADSDPANTGAGSATARTMIVGGQTRGFSGAMTTGTYGLNSDVYVLRVADTSGSIDINDGVGHPYRQAVLERILNRLGDEFVPPIATLGTRMMQNRPAAGFATKEEVKSLAGLTDAEMAILSPNITTYAWKDPDVANPVPLSADAKAAYYVPTATFSDPAGNLEPALFKVRPTGEALGRYGRSRRADGTLNLGKMMFNNELGTSAFTNAAHLRDCSIYGWDELNARYIEVTPRAPVNVNTATREVLTSLIVDLQGFFLVEQKHPCGNYQQGYEHGVMYFDYLNTDTHYPGGTTNTNETYQYAHTAGEIGVLFKTMAVSPALARTVADEIIACRTKGACANLHGGIAHDYNVLPFGGQFTDWQQFEMFIDWLVEDQDEDPPSLADSVIKDTNLRGAASVNAGFYVYPLQDNTNADNAGQQNPPSGCSGYQAYGSLAMADAIKANFNPNLHLNEANPDQVLFKHVDKTDLIQPSTEFTFRPTGTFEVESVGRVLAPVGDIDALTAPDNILKSEKKVVSIVSMFKPKRFTTQRQFYGDSAGFEGTAGANFHTISNTSDGCTALNKTLVIGPEVDNGPAPAENGYEGYIALSTYGGVMPVGTNKAPKALIKTDAHYVASSVSEGATLVNATCHAHFDFDFDLHSSKTRNTPLTVAPYDISATINGTVRKIIEPPTGAKICRDQAQTAIHFQTAGSGGYWNYHDRTETAAGYQSPYCPAYDSNRYWLATTYEWDKLTQAVKLPSYFSVAGASTRSFLTVTAPTDLRIDGALVERHTGLLYLPDGDGFAETLTDNNIDSRHGTCAYWIKPAFEPDLTGKHRQLWGIDAGGRGGFNKGAMKMFGHWWLASSKHGGQDIRVGYRTGNNQNNPVTNDFDDSTGTGSYENLFWNNLMFGGTFHRVAGKPEDSLFPPSSIVKKLGSNGGPYTPHQWAASTKLTHYMWSDGSDPIATTHDHPLVPKHRQLAMPHLWTHLAGSYVKEGNPLILDTEVYPKLYRLIHGALNGDGTYQSPRVDWRMLVNGREVNPGGGDNAKIDRLYSQWGTQHKEVRNFKAGGSGADKEYACAVYWDTNDNPFYLWFTAFDEVNEKSMYPTPVNNILYRRHTIMDYNFNDDNEKYKKDVPIPATALDNRGQPWSQMCPMAIGAPSYADKCHESSTVSIGLWARNYPPDSTVDEFYMYDRAWNTGAVTGWGLPAFTDARDSLWNKGRYYRKSDGVYESPLLDPVMWLEPGATPRVLPTASATVPPPGSAGTPLPVPGGAAAASGVPRVIGVAWTVFCDPHRDAVTKQTLEAGLQTRSTLRTFKYLLHDFNATDQELPPVDLNPMIEMYISPDAGATWQGPFTDWTYQALSISATAGTKIKYRLAFKWDTLPNAIDPINTVLLQSPIVDDVTFYMDDNRYIAYWFLP